MPNAKPKPATTSRLLAHSMRKGTTPAGAPRSTSSFAAAAWLMIPRPFRRNMIATRTRERARTYRWREFIGDSYDARPKLQIARSDAAADLCVHRQCELKSRLQLASSLQEAIRQLARLSPCR